MKKLAVFLLAMMCVVGAAAQNNYFFPTSKGTELSYKYYDRRGKVLKDDWKNVRWMKFTVEEVWLQENGMVINVGIANETIERLAKSKATEQVAENLSYGDVKIVGDSVVCDNMQWVAAVEPEMLAYMTARGDDGPKFRVELTALTAFPREMSIGDALPNEKILDAKYFVVLTDEQIAESKKQMEEFRAEARAMGYDMPSLPSNPSINAGARTQNRKVEAFEKVKTPAGTFDCYKITYELVAPNVLGIGFFMSLAYSDLPDEEAMRQAQHELTIKHADWISPQVGLVKREKYNDKGKVQEVMILDSVTE